MLPTLTPVFKTHLTQSDRTEHLIAKVKPYLLTEFSLPAEKLFAPTTGVILTQPETLHYIRFCSRLATLLRNSPLSLFPRDLYLLRDFINSIALNLFLSVRPLLTPSAGKAKSRNKTTRPPTPTIST